MKKTEILKQTYEVSNSFDTEAMFVALQGQVNNKIFRELIRQEKHSLTLEFRILVNEEEKEDKDPRLVELVDCVQLFKDLLKSCKDNGTDPVLESLGKGSDTLFTAWMKSVEIITNKY